MSPEVTDSDIEFEQVKKKRRTEIPEKDTDPQICRAKDNDTCSCLISSQDLNEPVEQRQDVKVASYSQELVEVKADIPPVEQKEEMDVEHELGQVKKMRTESLEKDTDPLICSGKDNDTGNDSASDQDLNESVEQRHQEIDVKVASFSPELVEVNADMLSVEQKQEIDVKVAISSQELLEEKAGMPTAKEEKFEVSAGTDLTGRSKRKLLVLDLNGLLADVVASVPDNYQADVVVGIKKVFKRPYHTDFLQFCFERFDVGIWSSRTKRNVDMFIDILLGDSKSKLLFCWDQSHCTETGFMTLENRDKPLLLKEIKKLWDKHGPGLPWERGYYGESNTLLIDDSPYKALKNPPNTAIFPDTYHYSDVKDNALGVGGDLRVYLERLSGASDVQKYVQENPYGQQSITDSHPNWHYYAKVIGIELDFRDTINEDKGTTKCLKGKHVFNEAIVLGELSKPLSNWDRLTRGTELGLEHTSNAGKEIAERPKSKNMSGVDMVLGESSEQLSNWDRLTRRAKEEIDLRVAIQKPEGSSNFTNVEKATCGQNRPNESNKRYRQYTSRGPVHPSSRVDQHSCYAANGRERNPQAQQTVPRFVGRGLAPRSRRKLLILDMNGVLADVLPLDKHSNTPGAVIGGRAVVRRPFSDEFMRFCFERFHVGFWLATSRRNAERNLEFLLGEKAKDLIFAWDITQCFETEFVTQNNLNKNIIVKEIRKLWDKIEPFLPWRRGEFDETNTLMVDVYPHAALLNPPNTAIFPHKYRYSSGEDNALEPGGELQQYLERVAHAENVQEYVQNNQFRGQQPITESHPNWFYYRNVIERTQSQLETERNKWYNK